MIQKQETINSMLRPDPCFNDDGYFTFRRVSLRNSKVGAMKPPKSDAFHDTTLSAASLNEKLIRLRINTPTNPQNVTKFSRANRTPESLSKMSPMIKRKSALPQTRLNELNSSRHPSSKHLKKTGGRKLNWGAPSQAPSNSRNCIQRNVTPTASKLLSNSTTTSPKHPKAHSRNFWVQKRTETLSISSSLLNSRKSKFPAHHTLGKLNHHSKSEFLFVFIEFAQNPSITGNGRDSYFIGKLERVKLSSVKNSILNRLRAESEE